jgi:hypothetical protein
MTFSEAVAKVEEKYWDGHTKRRQQRDRGSISQQYSWRCVYGDSFKLLREDRIVNLSYIISVVNSKKPGIKCFKNCLPAMGKLAEAIGNTDLYHVRSIDRDTIDC